MNADLPALRIVQPTEGDGYMIVVRDLFQGVEALSTSSPNVSPRGCALIAAHTLECALKAFLWHKGKTTRIKKPKGQPKGDHDLVHLWSIAYEEGLPVSQEPPDWVTILSSGHGPNFYFRYQAGKGRTFVHGGATPALIPMTAELKKVIDVVEHAVKD
ncbi:MAG: hypothetical protein Q8O38_04170 [Sulfurimicrobium sp.]|nr:hypothetical protein [Sulfurimicrobium sp.]